MKVNRKLILPVAAVASIAGAGVIGVGAAHAAQGNNNKGPHMVVRDMGGGDIAQKIADKFHLDKNQVQQVIDEAHAEERKQMDAEFTKRLDQAVSEGKLTAEQKTTILSYRDKMHKLMEDLKGKSPQEHKAAVDALIKEMQAWAEANKIDQKWMMPGIGLHIDGEETRADHKQ